MYVAARTGAGARDFACTPVVLLQAPARAQAGKRARTNTHARAHVYEHTHSHTQTHTFNLNDLRYKRDALPGGRDILHACRCLDA